MSAQQGPVYVLDGLVICERISVWLVPTSESVSTEEKVRRATEAALNKNLSPTERKLAMQRALRSSGRPRGRPRDESSIQAFWALFMHRCERKPGTRSRLF